MERRESLGTRVVGWLYLVLMRGQYWVKLKAAEKAIAFRHLVLATIGVRIRLLDERYRQFGENDEDDVRVGNVLRCLLRLSESESSVPMSMFTMTRRVSWISQKKMPT
jgi:hypothetical protein